MSRLFILPMVLLAASVITTHQAVADTLPEPSSMVILDAPIGIHKLNPDRKILIGQSYVLTSYSGKTYTGSSVSLSWDNHSSFSAKICNTINAHIPQVKAGYSRKIRSNSVTSTKMACADPLLSSMEDTFIKGLSEGMTVIRTKETDTKKETVRFRTKSGIVFIFNHEATFME